MIQLRRTLAAALSLGALTACGVHTIERDLDGRNAYNRAGLVVIDPDTPHRAAVWAQEAWEASQKIDPASAIAVRVDHSAQRRFELMGHEVEVQAAVLVYGLDAANYRRSEARSMARGYDGLFDRWTLEKIIDGMADRGPTARRWVENHRSEIEAQR